jgi:hypothetical protein
MLRATRARRRAENSPPPAPFLTLLISCSVFPFRAAQVALGDKAKAAERVTVFVTTEQGAKYALGSLTQVRKRDSQALGPSRPWRLLGWLGTGMCRLAPPRRRSCRQQRSRTQRCGVLAPAGCAALAARSSPQHNTRSVALA